MATVSTLVMLMGSFNPALTSQTAASLAVLLRGAVLSPRERTVTACLVAAWPWVRKGWQAYENVLRRARFRMLQLARILFGPALRLVPEGKPVCLVVDEHLVRRWGARPALHGRPRSAADTERALQPAFVPKRNRRRSREQGHRKRQADERPDISPHRYHVRFSPSPLRSVRWHFTRAAHPDAYGGAYTPP